MASTVLAPSPSKAEQSLWSLAESESLCWSRDSKLCTTGDVSGVYGGKWNVFRCQGGRRALNWACRTVCAEVLRLCKPFPICLGGWSQMISGEASWCSYTVCAVVRPVGCTTKSCETMWRWHLVVGWTVGQQLWGAFLCFCIVYFICRRMGAKTNMLCFYFCWL